MGLSLRDRRGELEHDWQAGVVEHLARPTSRPEVIASWQRSGHSVTPDIPAAPVDDPDDVAAGWTESRLGRASRVILDDLTDLAAGGDMMAAITDQTVRIAWVAGGRSMTRRAERVNFTVGGCWSEEAVGTNALALAERTLHPASVFSAEHFAPIVHDWVCYSAPITDPQSGRFLGVIDVSAVWQRANPALLTTVGALARCVEYELRATRTEAPGHNEAWPPTVGIGLRTLGGALLTVDGTEVPVSPRQLEILTVLSLHPAGLTLDELTGRVYGDRTVSPSTVKAELSRLRHLLGGRIGSRPYRLVGPVTADHQLAVGALEAGDVGQALALCAGPMLPFSESPDIGYWRAHLEVTIGDEVIRSRQPALLLQLSSLRPDDPHVHEAALEVLAPDDARRSMVLGRLAASERYG